MFKLPSSLVLMISNFDDFINISLRDRLKKCGQKSDIICLGLAWFYSFISFNILHWSLISMFYTCTGILFRQTPIIIVMSTTPTHET